MSILCSYTKYVQKSLSRAETLLKLLLPSNYPPEGLINNYLILTGDSHPHHFQWILELKGLKKTEQQVLLDHFQRILLSRQSSQESPSSVPNASLQHSQKAATAPPEPPAVASSHSYPLSSSALITHSGQEFTKASQRINENLRKFVLTMKRSG
jgi:hypothetical protein